MTSREGCSPTCSVCWEVGEVCGHNGGRGYWGLEGADEGVSVDWLHCLWLLAGALSADSKARADLSNRQSSSEACWPGDAGTACKNLLAGKECRGHGEGCRDSQGFESRWLAFMLRLLGYLRPIRKIFRFLFCHRQKSPRDTLEIACRALNLSLNALYRMYDHMHDHQQHHALCNVPAMQMLHHCAAAWFRVWVHEQFPRPSTSQRLS